MQRRFIKYKRPWAKAELFLQPPAINRSWLASAVTKFMAIPITYACLLRHKGVRSLVHAGPTKIHPAATEKESSSLV